jgi:hypothetical protein
MPTTANEYRRYAQECIESDTLGGGHPQFREREIPRGPRFKPVAAGLAAIEN